MRPVCFLSDFGLADDFVGTCKGVMLRIAPGLHIVDLTHEVPGFAVEAGAEILQHATRYMPADAVYLAVVDPGVGTGRRELALQTEGGALLVGPDNGLLIPAAESLGGVSEAVVLTDERYHQKPISNTFHGRDVFAPIAGHLAVGAELSGLGEAVEPSSLVRLDPPRVVSETGEGVGARVRQQPKSGRGRRQDVGPIRGDLRVCQDRRTGACPRLPLAPEPRHKPGQRRSGARAWGRQEGAPDTHCGPYGRSTSGRNTQCLSAGIPPLARRRVRGPFHSRPRSGAG